MPTYLQVVNEIPKTASEKPQERFLLEQFDEQAAMIFTEGPDLANHGAGFPNALDGNIHTTICLGNNFLYSIIRREEIRGAHGLCGLQSNPVAGQ